jgi:hypothetical protein
MGASPVGFDRLVRKEVALGAIRDVPPPQNHIGLQIAPFLEVASDDVIFDYIKSGLQEGLAPARAEDAEAELAQKDEMTWGQGRASIIDWALKDKYTASDVTRYREDLLIREALQGTGTTLNLNFTGRTIEDFERRLAREDALRKKKLDNRLEWLTMNALQNGVIAYDDGKIKFSVDYKRPAEQQDVTPTSGLWDAGSNADFDPIGDILSFNEAFYDTYGIYLRRAITSRKTLNSLYKSSKFRDAWAFRGGLTGLDDASLANFDPNYMSAGYGPAGARALFQQQTGLTDIIEYDSVYQTRAIGSTTTVNQRFTSDDRLILLPDPADLRAIGIDDTEIGFGKMLTSPHPEGNWSPGWYEWEDAQKDPWMQVRGTGIKAFPVFPYMKYSAVLKVR